MSVLTARRLSRRQSTSDHSWWLWLTAISGLGLILRLVSIGIRAIWLDEAYSLDVAIEPLSAIWNWSAPAEPADPPLYFTLLHFWVGFGDGETTVRLLSASLGAAIVPLAAVLGRMLAGRRVGLLTAFLVAVSPILIRYSQEARMYSLLGLLVLAFITIGAWLSLRPERSGRPFGSGIRSIWRGDTDFGRLRTDALWIALSLAVGGSLLTHHTAALAVFGLNVAVVAWAFAHRYKRRFWWNWFGSQLGAFVVWAAWIPGLPAQFRWFSESGGGTFLPTTAYDIGRTFTSLYAQGSVWVASLLPAPIDRQRTVMILFGVIVALLIGRALYIWWRQRLFTAWLALCMGLSMIGGPLAISAIWPIFLPRIVLSTIPLVVIAAAAGALSLGKYLRAGGVAALVLMALLGLGNYYVAFEHDRYDLAANEVSESWENGDVVAFVFSDTELPYRYYDRRPELVTLPVVDADIERIGTITSAYERVWLVYAHDVLHDPDGRAPSALAEARPLIAHIEYSGVDLYLFGR